MTQPKTASKSSSHTPGPWEWTQYSPTTAEHHSASLSSSDDDGVLFHQAAWQVSNANARLIAAAPEMYELLEIVESYYHDAPQLHPHDWGTIVNVARRIKAAVDGEG